MTDGTENRKYDGIAITDSEAELVTGGMADYDIEDRVKSCFLDLKQAVDLLPDDGLFKPIIDDYMGRCEAAIIARNWHDIRDCCGLVNTVAHSAAPGTAEYELIRRHTFTIIDLLSQY